MIFLIEISYRTTQLRKVCEDAEAATRKYGAELADRLHERLDQIRAATSVEMLALATPFSTERLKSLTSYAGSVTMISAPLTNA